MPMKTEIAPLLIVTQLEQYDYAGATAIAAVLLVVSFALLLAINALQRWGARRLGGAAERRDEASSAPTGRSHGAPRRRPRSRAPRTRPGCARC